MPLQVRHTLIFWGFGRAGFKKSFKFVRIVQAEDLKRNEACADRHLKFERLDESKRATSECLVWFLDGESRLVWLFVNAGEFSFY